MTIRILLLNIHSSRNAGDAALTQVTVEQLKCYFPHSHLVLAMDDPSSHSGEGQAIDSFFSWVRRTGDKWRMGRLAWLIPASITPVLTYRLFGRPIFALTPKSWRALLQAYIRSHMVVSKPGGFLYSSGRGVTFIISVYSLALAVLAGKPVYVLPQSIGPLSRQWEHTLLRWVLERVRIVMVREAISFHQLQALGLSPQHSYLMPDLAFGFSGAPASAAENWLQSRGIGRDHSSPLLGITAVNWEAQNPRFEQQANYEVACAAAARFFVEQYRGRVILFPQVLGPSASQDDRIPARRIAGQLADVAQCIFMIEQPPPADLLKSIYGLMDLFIGTRMHSNVFALSEGVPVIAIGYQHKTTGIMRMAGLGRWHIDIQQVTEEALIEMLVVLWEEQSLVRAHLKQRIPALIQQAERVGAIVAADFCAL